MKARAGSTTPDQKTKRTTLRKSKEEGGQRGRVVNASDSQSGGPRFESRSGHLLDLFTGGPGSNPRPRL